MAISHVDIRMYNTGTGDCFALKFFKNRKVVFKMMIDGGTWSGSKRKLSRYVSDLKDFVEEEIDVLVITHEHKDHVYLFEVCEDLFTNNFKVGVIWMAWTEDEQDELAQKWKAIFGQKKKALAMASEKINTALNSNSFKNSVGEEFYAKSIDMGFKSFSLGLEEFSELHSNLGANKVYKGDLKGMKVIKDKIASNNIRYFTPGQIESLPSLPGVKFFILGPPRAIKAIKKEHGHKPGDTYDHNKVLRRSDSFAAAVTDESSLMGQSPFDNQYIADSTKASEAYENDESKWRSVDIDWLMTGAGNLALRLNSGINNLSLVLAIEFEETGKVMLFPGDAEFGSWESWHKIEWSDSYNSRRNLAADLLKRTVFYKVAHHLSHNGTAKDKGLRMMKSKDLVAMATLDFNVISNNWKSTMPNRGILKDLIHQAKGRLIIMNEKHLYYDFKGKVKLQDRINDVRNKMITKDKKKFDESYTKTTLYHEYRLKL